MKAVATFTLNIVTDDTHLCGIITQGSVKWKSTSEPIKKTTVWLAGQQVDDQLSELDFLHSNFISLTLLHSTSYKLDNYKTHILQTTHVALIYRFHFQLFVSRMPNCDIDAYTYRVVCVSKTTSI